jgi:(R)-2-hydroxyacyl-CoA dehydratese activating ATPase
MSSATGYFMGIDAGSRSCKGVIYHCERGIVAHHSLSPRTDYAVSLEKLREELLTMAGLEPKDIAYIVSTGYNTKVSFSNEYVTDIQCSARGVHRMCPGVRTIVDIQSQTSQVIRLGESGLISNFTVSEKCAAGSGRFLDIVANVLRVPVGELGPLSLKSRKRVTFSTGCAVFGESETISRVAEGIAIEDIVAGVHFSIADKIAALVARAGMEEPFAIVGGGALNAGLVRSIEERLAIKAVIPPHPDLMAAIGAAVAAAAVAATADGGAPAGSHRSRDRSPGT